MTKRKKNNTHLTLEGRKVIEEKLDENCSIRQIADKMHRDRSNIGREIEKHRKVSYPSSFNRSNPCKKHNTCFNRYFECYKTCIEFEELNPCEKLSSSPHVCNGCDKKAGCRHVRYYYNANEANIEYLNTLINSRKGTHYTELEMNVLNNDFSDLVRNNKSIYHSLIVINKQGFNFKKSTIYELIKKGLINLKSNELPRNNRKRKKEIDKKEYKREISGHTYEDYENFKKNNEKAIEMQMDTVEGIKDGRDPVLLTLEIVEIKFFFAFLIDNQNQIKVIEKLDELKNLMGIELFDKIFEILLTDNGKEFNNPTQFMELSKNINLFYCHPYSSFEKGSIENTHELLRRVIPKGISLTPYTQEEINLICNHINSLYRKELDGKCPFELIEKYIPIEILKKLHYERIPEENVTLIPELLGNKNIDNIKKYLTPDMIKKSNITFNT